MLQQEKRQSEGLQTASLIKRPASKLAILAAALSAVACTTQTEYHGKVNTFRNDVEKTKGVAVRGEMKPVVIGHIHPSQAPQGGSFFDAAMGQLSTTAPTCSPSKICLVKYVPVPKEYEAINTEKVLTPALMRFAVDLTKELIRAGGNIFAAGQIDAAKINNTISNVNQQTQGQWQSMSQEQRQAVINYINEHCRPGQGESGAGIPPRTSSYQTETDVYYVNLGGSALPKITLNA